MALSAEWFTRKEKGWGTVHNWPSNFYLEEDDTTVEAEFQIAKHEGHPWRQFILRRKQSNPAACKRLGRRWKLTKEELAHWEAVKVDTMYYLVLQKIIDWPEFAQALQDTGGGMLVETNWWHDNFWGDCTCLKCYRKGENHLGKILMSIREEIG